jgi:hypothetical protein
VRKAQNQPAVTPADSAVKVLHLAAAVGEQKVPVVAAAARESVPSDLRLEAWEGRGLKCPASAR